MGRYLRETKTRGTNKDKLAAAEKLSGLKRQERKRLWQKPPSNALLCTPACCSAVHGWFGAANSSRSLHLGVTPPADGLFFAPAESEIAAPETRREEGGPQKRR